MDELSPLSTSVVELRAAGREGKSFRLGLIMLLGHGAVESHESPQLRWRGGEAAEIGCFRNRTVCACVSVCISSGSATVPASASVFLSEEEHLAVSQCMYAYDMVRRSV